MQCNILWLYIYYLMSLFVIFLHVNNRDITPWEELTTAFNRPGGSTLLLGHALGRRKEPGSFFSLDRHSAKRSWGWKLKRFLWVWTQNGHIGDFAWGLMFDGYFASIGSNNWGFDAEKVPRHFAIWIISSDLVFVGPSIRMTKKSWPSTSFCKVPSKSSKCGFQKRPVFKSSRSFASFKPFETIGFTKMLILK